MQVKQQLIRYLYSHLGKNSYTNIYYYFKGKIHRDGDLPAHYHFKNGKLNCVYYCQHDKEHRTTGPAVIFYEDKIKEYYYQSKKYASLGEMQMIETCK